jgi:hypothetical protein
MPSERELELRHKINGNKAYQVNDEPANKRWLVRNRGRKMVVEHPRGEPARPRNR